MNRYGENPGKFFLAAYAAGQCVVEAISKTKSTSRNEISNWQHSNTIDTVIGEISFGEDGNMHGGSSGFRFYRISGDSWIGFDKAD